jgi:hypothetical protein
MCCIDPKEIKGDLVGRSAINQQQQRELIDYE